MKKKLKIESLFIYFGFDWSSLIVWDGEVILLLTGNALSANVVATITIQCTQNLLYIMNKTN